MKKIIMLGILIIILATGIAANNRITMPISKIIGAGGISVDSNDDGIIDRADTALKVPGSSIDYGSCNGEFLTGVDEGLSCKENVGNDCYTLSRKSTRSIVCEDTYHYCWWVESDICLSCGGDALLRARETYYYSTTFQKKSTIEITCCRDLEPSNSPKTNIHWWDIEWSQNRADSGDSC